MNKCAICSQKLTKRINPLTGAENALYCENCDIYWLNDGAGNFYPYCFIAIPQLLTEQKVPGAPQGKLRISIDTREEKHSNIPHFHIYYGIDHRSVGYKIDDLSALDIEKDAELLHMSGDVKKFLNDIEHWMPKKNKKEPSKTNKQYMLDMYKQIIGSQKQETKSGN